VAERRILIAAASRPYPTEVANGDAWHVDWQPSGCRIAVIDGLGHGPAAAEAASRARDALVDAPEADPIEGLRRCHGALRGSRGAAVSVITLDVIDNRLTYAGVGNVDARLMANGRTVRMPSMRGIVGATLPTLRSFEEALPPGWILFVHTDGIKDRFDPEELLEADRAEPQRLADAILARWGRATDDATIVVAAANSID